MTEHGILLLAALIIDWKIGDPIWIWNKIPHPVASMGGAISWLERRLNSDKTNAATLMRRGSLMIVLLIISTVIIGVGLERSFGHLKQIGVALEVILVSIFLAQNSLITHVDDVVKGLRTGGVKGGRKAVALIVGRDPQHLEREDISRAAIESLAENFGDGVVAPAFWYLVFGLPGLLAYKMINTADSMIGYKNDRYLHFGRSAAKIDDLANWLPARISVIAIMIASFFLYGWQRMRGVGAIVLRDAGLHNSPNAGWPEAAMAGATDFALGGPRYYSGVKTSQAFINASGKHDLDATDIEVAMRVFTRACFGVWALVFVAFVLGYCC